MTSIEFDVDAYGTYARGSALADVIELWAIRGHPVTEATVEDYLDDLGWGRTNWEHLAGEGLPDVMPWGVLEERRDALGGAYPFELATTGLSFTGARDDPYVRLLAISLAHAHGVHVPLAATQVFEEVVVRALENRGLTAANLSQLRSAHGDFQAALAAAGEVIGIPIAMPLGLHAIAAKDEAVDALGHLDWRDGRVGKWLVLGQVTCAKSDEWRGKANEVPMARFRGFFGTMIDPIPFLAIPFHAHEARLRYVIEDQGRMLLDRLRLAGSLGDPAPGEQDIVDAVLTAQIDPPGGVALIRPNN